jgi:glucosamine-6-phosphate deaminase
MQIFVCKNDKEIGDKVSTEILKLIEKNPQAVLGLATGSSPLATYAALVNKAKALRVSFAKVTTFNLDEYLDCSDPKQTYHVFMAEHLFNALDFNPKNLNFPSVENLSTYDQMIAKAGGVDLQLLGIGVNGHVGFNEPGTAPDSLTHIITLSDTTRRSNSRFFKNDIDLVPKQAVSEGLATIAKSKHIIMIADDLTKQMAIHHLLYGHGDPNVPATALLAHSNFDLYLTKELYEAAK